MVMMCERNKFTTVNFGALESSPSDTLGKMCSYEEATVFAERVQKSVSRALGIPALRDISSKDSAVLWKKFFDAHPNV